MQSSKRMLVSNLIGIVGPDSYLYTCMIIFPCLSCKYAKASEDMIMHSCIWMVSYYELWNFSIMGFRFNFRCLHFALWIIDNKTMVIFWERLIQVMLNLWTLKFNSISGTLLMNGDLSWCSACMGAAHGNPLEAGFVTNTYKF